MKKSLLVVAMLVAGAGSLAADAVQPQLNLNLDGSIGIKSEPTDQAGHGIGGVSGGFEYIPDELQQYLGFDVDYNYLAVGKPAQARDSDIDISLRGFSPNCGPVTGWLQGGIGYNTTPNYVNGHWLAFVEPGVRWMVLPRLALDGGIQYLVQTPKSAFVQSFSLVLGFSIPLDADFLIAGHASAGANQ